MDWLDLLAVQGTLKSLLQHHSSKASILRCSAFFVVQLSHPYMTTGKTIALTRRNFVGKVMALLSNMLSRLVVTQRLKRLPPMRETRVRSLSREDPLEKEMITHSSILAWTVPMDIGTWQAAVLGSRKESDTTVQLSKVQHRGIGFWEGNGKVLW